MKIEIGFNVTLIGDGVSSTVDVLLESSAIDITYGGNNDGFRSRRIFYPDGVNSVGNGGGGPAITAATVAHGVLSLTYAGVVANGTSTSITGVFEYEV